MCAIKGFNSTGSKLTDAVREIEAMAEVRQPRQFVFAVVDGIGWLSRQADLRRIHVLAAEKSIDGLFALANMHTFQEQIVQAALSHHLISDSGGSSSGGWTRIERTQDASTVTDRWF